MADISKIDIERINGLLDKLNSMKYIIETGESEDGNQWYRKWSDGWIEQGGYINQRSGTVTFLKSYVHSPNVFQQNINSGNVDAYYKGLSISNITVNGFNKSESSYVDEIYWYACGY